MSKHTPGPWKAAPCCNLHPESEAWPWLSVKGPPTGGACGHQYKPADARLIAAAPDLFDLIVNPERAEIDSSGRVVLRLDPEKYRAAIAKAEGRAAQAGQDGQG